MENSSIFLDDFPFEIWNPHLLRIFPGHVKWHRSLHSIPCKMLKSPMIYHWCICIYIYIPFIFRWSCSHSTPKISQDNIFMKSLQKAEHHTSLPVVLLSLPPCRSSGPRRASDLSQAVAGGEYMGILYSTSWELLQFVILSSTLCFIDVKLRRVNLGIGPTIVRM